MLHQLKSASVGEVSAFFFVANVGVFAASVLLCWALGVAFANKRIFDRWEPLRPFEVGVAASAVVFNSAISVVGWFLWTRDGIVLTTPGLFRSVIDCLVMILVMDLGMYVFHRIAHLPPIYDWVHRFHHRHETTNPISLFVLHPLEVLGFGSLMIVFLALYPMAIGGLMAYLTLNMLFGTLGHSGVEPFPVMVNKMPLLRLVGTSTFHAEHHENPGYNYGFYTLLWDKLFGTLDPDYNRRFCQKN